MISKPLLSRLAILSAMACLVSTPARADFCSSLEPFRDYLAGRGTPEFSANPSLGQSETECTVSDSLFGRHFGCYWDNADLQFFGKSDALALAEAMQGCPFLTLDEKEEFEDGIEYTFHAGGAEFVLGSDADGIYLEGNV